MYLCILFLWGSLPSQAQAPRSLEVQGDYTFLFLHSQSVRPIGQSYPWGVGVDYSWWLLKEKNWHNCRCYPRIGLSMNYHNFDNPEVLGWGLPVYGFLEPAYRLRGNLFFTLRGGVGYAWLSKPHDAETNPLNLSYSLPFTPYIMLGTGLAYRFTEHWRLGVQLRYHHLSNGGMQEPNKGLNYPGGALSLSYSWQPLPLRQRPATPLDKKALQKAISVQTFVAGKAVDASRVTYAVPGLEVRYTHQLDRVSALTGGVEWIYNFAYRERIRQAGSNEDPHQLGVLLGHAFLMGNFTFTQMAGFYLHKGYDNFPDWYQRYGLVWYPWANFSIGTQIKVHGHVAEFLDFRIGYRYSL